MTCTIVCQVVDRSGIAAWYWNGAFGGRHLDRVQAHPAHAFGDRQPGTIPVSIGHGTEVLGHVDYLEHGLEQNTDLRAVAVVDLDPEQVNGLYCSADLEARYRGDSLTAEECTLTALALVGQTAGVGARPVRAFAGDFRNSWERSSRPGASILDRAAKAVGAECRWKRPTSLSITRPTDPEPRIAAGLAPLEVQAQSPGQPRYSLGGQLLEMRSAPTLGVTERSRIIEVLAAPVGEDAAVIIHGKIVAERFEFGCFAGDEHRVDRVKANRDHDPQRTIGKAVRIDPYSKLRCVAELRIARTPLGDETLALAEEHCLDASVGFRVRPGGEEWDAGRTRRQVTKGELDHVALVPDPAYIGANVLAVRSTP